MAGANKQEPPQRPARQPASAEPTRPQRLRELLLSPELTILMEAHNGLSAKLAEEAGFPALWASGLSISAALGVRDSNEASWTQVLEVLEFMSDSTSLPILVDGDTGYGNFNNVRRLVRKLEQRGIAGVCLEDKQFPKQNSFIAGHTQRLAAVDEFCGKLRAAKDTLRDDRFVLVARTEALIARQGLDEALLRATAYADSGADLVLVHSQSRDGDELAAFIERWDSRVPLLLVPTSFPKDAVPRFSKLGVSNFIFANQALRSVVTALQHNLRRLWQTQDLLSIESEIAPLSEVFRLQDMQELESSQARYLPAPPSAAGQRVGASPGPSGAPTSSPRRALMLAATRGDFGALVEHKPKAMLELNGKPILGWQVDAFRRHGVSRIAAVVGHAKHAVQLPGVQCFENAAHASSGELWSLYAARDFLHGELVITYGDIVFDDFILGNLLAQPRPINLAVDAAWKLRQRDDDVRDWVATSGAADALGETRCQLELIGNELEPSRISGEWIGLVYLKADATRALAETLDRLAQQEPNVLRHAGLPDLLNRMLRDGHAIDVVHSYGHWHDLDERSDLVAASAHGER